MQFAFDTAIHPAWDLPAVAAHARDLGYDGADVHLPHAAGGDPAAGSAVAERDLVRLAFEQAGVRLAGLAADLRFADDCEADARTADAVRRVIDLAARLRCGRARVPCPAVRPRTDRGAAGLRFADWLAPLADHAGRAGVTLLVQNAFSIPTARDLWGIAERLRHPSVAVAWDPLAAALASEGPGVSVPTLNSRIGHVLLRDAILTGGPGDRRIGAFRPPGDGDLALARLLDRLRGVGYCGWVSVSYPPDAGLGQPAAVLAAARERLRRWDPPPAKPTSGPKKASAAGTK